MDSSLLLAFLAFGAACSSLWAWLLATASEQRHGMEALHQPVARRPGRDAPPPQGR